MTQACLLLSQRRAERAISTHNAVVSRANPNTPAGFAPTYLALPGSGAGSDFDNPIPQTGAANAGVADFGTTQERYLYTTGTDNKFDSDVFTIEAYVNWSGSTSDAIIASQSGQDEDGKNDKSWQFGVEDKDGTTYLYLTEDGTHNTHRFYRANLPMALTVGKDYYVAASFDLSAQTGGMKLYVKDLTAGTAMQTLTQGHDMAALNDSDEDFVIGTRLPARYEWTGLIDEVRLSNTVLSESELLVSVPEPGTLVLLGFGVLMLLPVVRRRK